MKQCDLEPNPIYDSFDNKNILFKHKTIRFGGFFKSNCSLYEKILFDLLNQNITVEIVSGNDKYKLTDIKF